tara:strand:- start:149 stop:964 length:816 start_codon:yes stop_codon:yes gene_type:complete
MRTFLVTLHKIIFFKRLVPSLLRRLSFNRLIAVKIDNFLINLNLASTIDRYIYLNGFYDRDKINFIEDKIDLNSYDYFLDIGSNIGFYSLYIASKYKNLNIMAFEPIHENYFQIEKSKKLNNFENINIYKYALSNKKNEIKMWTTNLNKKGGFAVYDDKDYKNEIEVNNYNKDKIYKRSLVSEVFDDNFKIENKKIFIKIDVERHEFQCLKGMLRLLQDSNNKVFIQIEIINKYKKQVLDLLKKMNFRLVNTINADGNKDIYGSDYYLSNF